MPDIFGALNDLSDDLLANGLLPDPAFSLATIAGVIDIDESGQVIAVQALTGKSVLREMVPALPARTSGIVAAYLTGSPEYWIGPSPRHEAQASLHRELLGGVDHPSALALMRFLARADHTPLPSIKGFWAVRHRGEMLHREPALTAPWALRYRPAGDINPRVKGWPQHSMLRAGLRSNSPATKSYEDDTAVIARAKPERAIDALDWLMGRKSTVRNGDTAVIAWLSGNPHVDPTPNVLPSWHHEADDLLGDMSGTLNVAVLDARPPSRMSVRYYWSGDADQALQRLNAADQTMRLIATPFFKPGTKVIWQHVFRAARWPDMVMSMLQAILNGDPVPGGLLVEIIRLHRKNMADSDGIISGAILRYWAESRGLL